MKKSNTRLKICGITRTEDAMSAVQCGADALGFVFYAKSPRFITPQSAQHIISQLPPFVVTVGLFVNASQHEIDTVLQHCSLDVIQLHGDETPAFCAAQSRRAIKAIPIAAADDLDRINDFDCAVLLDTKAPKDVYGGTGTSFDWNMLKNLNSDDDMLERKEEAIELLPEEYHDFISDNDEVTTITYPVIGYPEKVKSMKLDKFPVIEKKLNGIKGQYLIFDDDTVMNMRSHAGYRIAIEW